MPENKTIHDLPIAEQTNASDVFETEIPSQLMQSGYASRKVTMSSLENHILGTEQYETQLSNFPQGSRSVFSALEYARQSGGGGGGASANEALPYDENSSYEYGDYCIQNNYLWRCISTTTVTGAWDATKWIAVLVTDEYKRVRIMNKAAFDLLSADEKDGFIYVSDYPTKIQDIDNVNLNTSDNNKLLGVSVSGSDISVVAVDKTYDSGWQPITLPSGFTQLSYIGAQARRIGDIVYIELGVENTSVVPTFTVVGTVPVSMKPLIEVNVCGRCMNDIALFSINRNTGAISFLASPSASGAKQFMLCISYPVT